MLSITKPHTNAVELAPFAGLTLVCVAVVGILWATPALMFGGVLAGLLVLGF